MEEQEVPAVPEPVRQAEEAPLGREPSVRHRFAFTGHASECFRIWIVNVALSVLTLGIYSAWATVRTRRWFYAHTRLGDSSFSYHARPVPILIGRAIAFSLLGAYFVTAHLVPWAVILFIPVALVVMPPLVVRSLRFRARYSAWRGLHFRFTGAYSEAWTRYGLALLLVPLTLGFALPFVHATQKEYLVGNHHFGGRTFRVRPLGSVYFEAFAKAVGLGIAVVFLTVLFLMLLSTREGPVRSGGWVPAEAAGVVLGYAGMFTVGVYYTTRVLNGMYNHTGLGKFRFESRLQARRMVGLYLANTLAVVLTLGLAYPWARVQMARYRARSLAVVGPEDLDGFVAEAREHQEAVGAEIGDAFDVDIGI